MPLSFTRFPALVFLLLALSFVAAAPRALADYSQHPQAQAFVHKMVSDHGFDQGELTALFAQVEKKPAILEAIARPAEKTKTWAEYRQIFIQPERVAGGVSFWRENREALARAERRFGVPAEYIVAIIGVETLYGKITGSYRVMDALSTLAFDYPPRREFFIGELEEYLRLMREYDKDPLAHLGSYAGAMGLGQFMPSSYRAYAVDFDGDQWPDIWQNTADAIGSVAHYFYRHGWQAGEYVAVRARPEPPLELDLPNPIAAPQAPVSQWRREGLTPVIEVPGEAQANAAVFDGVFGDEYWLTFNNFYVITRYNRSAMYALAVHQLAQDIYRQGRDWVQGVEPL